MSCDNGFSPQPTARIDRSILNTRSLLRCENTRALHSKRPARCVDCGRKSIRPLYANGTPVVPMPSNIRKVSVRDSELFQYTLPDSSLSLFVWTMLGISSPFGPEVISRPNSIEVVSPASALAKLRRAIAPCAVGALTRCDQRGPYCGPEILPPGCRQRASFQFGFQGCVPAERVLTAAL